MSVPVMIYPFFAFAVYCGQIIKLREWTTLMEKLSWILSALMQGDKSKHKDEILKKVSLTSNNKQVRYLDIFIVTAWSDFHKYL